MSEEEKIAIKIFKQADLETDVGGCSNCPRNDKDKTCINCKNYYIDILVNYTENLQQQIDKTKKLLNANTHIENIYHALCNLLLDDDYKYDIDDDELLSILKGEDEEC